MGINSAFKSTCKTLLGGEIGELREYEKYLQKYVEPVKKTKSAISGKDVYFTHNYADGTRFISNDEMGEYAKIIAKAKLDVNEIKDIDSIVSAIGEKVYYSGNILLGKSSDANVANRLVDSSVINKSHDVFYSKFVSHSYLVKYAEYVFGSVSIGKGMNSCIKCFETYDDSRVFECLRVYQSSGCTYSANLEHCQDCMYSFNLRSKRNCIGNLQLEKSEYLGLKEKLLEGIRDELEKKKDIVSIIEIVAKGKING